MGVLIRNSQSTPIKMEEIRKKAQAVLNALDCPDGELSILIVDDPQIAKLNKEYLNRTGATNVIAFPMQEGQFSQINPQLLGDVVISLETAGREGADAGIGMDGRLNQLLVHGILHLFGYDHENNGEEAARMESRSSELLNLLNTIEHGG